MRDVAAIVAGPVAWAVAVLGLAAAIAVHPPGGLRQEGYFFDTLPLPRPIKGTIK
jgi:hypothetical protein